MFGKVAVLMGGNSAERDISLMSGNAVLCALKNAGIKAQAVDTQTDFIQTLLDEKFDRAFIALHGRGGEDGSLQGLLDCIHLPYTGTGVLGSALAMDKVKSKQVWQTLGLPTLPTVVWQNEASLQKIRATMSLPLCVKPIYEGSSVGVSRIDTWEALLPAVTKAQQYGQVMIEPWIVGEEWTVGVLNGRPLPAICIQAANLFYDYDAKYFAGTTQYLCPGPLDELTAKALGRLALDAFNALGCTSWGRVDFIRDTQGQFWLLEVNTIPGLTETSLVPKAAKVCGLDFQALVLEILSQTFPQQSISNQKVQKGACETN